jgi:metal-responsive CopG/Arc/MetJ family transcriptional regulator
MKMGKIAKVTISLSRELLLEVDSIVKKSHCSRSSLVQEALESLVEEYLKKETKEKARRIYKDTAQSDRELADKFPSISSEALPQYKNDLKK